MFSVVEPVAETLVRCHLLACAALTRQRLNHLDPLWQASNATAPAAAAPAAPAAADTEEVARALRQLHASGGFDARPTLLEDAALWRNRCMRAVLAPAQPATGAAAAYGQMSLQSPTHELMPFVDKPLRTSRRLHSKTCGRNNTGAHMAAPIKQSRAPMWWWWWPSLCAAW